MIVLEHVLTHFNHYVEPTSSTLFNSPMTLSMLTVMSRIRSLKVVTHVISKISDHKSAKRFTPPDLEYKSLSVETIKKST